MSDSIPRLENCGRHLACNNQGQWFYINHGGTWQTFQGVDAANAVEYKARADAAEALLDDLLGWSVKQANWTIDWPSDHPISRARAFLAETAPKPVRLGDEEEG